MAEGGGVAPAPAAAQGEAAAASPHTPRPPPPPPRHREPRAPRPPPPAGTPQSDGRRAPRRAARPHNKGAKRSRPGPAAPPPQAPAVPWANALLALGGAAAGEGMAVHFAYTATPESATQWQQAECSGARPAARQGHAACVAGAHKAFVYGGVEAATGQVLSTLHVLGIPPSPRTWHTLVVSGDAEPPPLHRHVCAAASQGILVFGGSSDPASETVNTDIFLLDYEKQCWETLESDPPPDCCAVLGAAAHSAELADEGEVLLVYGGLTAAGGACTALCAWSTQRRGWSVVAPPHEDPPTAVPYWCRATGDFWLLAPGQSAVSRAPAAGGDRQWEEHSAECSVTVGFDSCTVVRCDAGCWLVGAESAPGGAQSVSAYYFDGAAGQWTVHTAAGRAPAPPPSSCPSPRTQPRPASPLPVLLPRSHTPRRGAPRRPLLRSALKGYAGVTSPRRADRWAPVGTGTPLPVVLRAVPNGPGVDIDLRGRDMGTDDYYLLATVLLERSRLPANAQSTVTLQLSDNPPVCDFAARILLELLHSNSSVVAIDFGNTKIRSAAWAARIEVQLEHNQRASAELLQLRKEEEARVKARRMLARERKLRELEWLREKQRFAVLDRYFLGRIVLLERWMRGVEEISHLLIWHRVLLEEQLDMRDIEHRRWLASQLHGARAAFESREGDSRAEFEAEEERQAVQLRSTMRVSRKHCEAAAKERSRRERAERDAQQAEEKAARATVREEEQSVYTRERTAWKDTLRSLEYAQRQRLQQLAEADRQKQRAEEERRLEQEREAQARERWEESRRKAQQQVYKDENSARFALSGEAQDARALLHESFQSSVSDVKEAERVGNARRDRARLNWQPPQLAVVGMAAECCALTTEGQLKTAGGGAGSCVFGERAQVTAVVAVPQYLLAGEQYDGDTETAEEWRSRKGRVVGGTMLFCVDPTHNHQRGTRVAVNVHPGPAPATLHWAGNREQRKDGILHWSAGPDGDDDRERPAVARVRRWFSAREAWALATGDPVADCPDDIDEDDQECGFEVELLEACTLTCVGALLRSVRVATDRQPPQPPLSLVVRLAIDFSAPQEGEGGDREYPAALTGGSITAEWQSTCSVVIVPPMLLMPAPMLSFQYHEGEGTARVFRNVTIYPPPGRRAAEGIFDGYELDVVFYSRRPEEDSLLFAKPRHADGVGENLVVAGKTLGKVERGASLFNPTRGSITGGLGKPTSPRAPRTEIFTCRLGASAAPPDVAQFLHALEYLNPSEAPTEEPRAISVAITAPDGWQCRLTVSISIVGEDDPTVVEFGLATAYYRMACGPCMEGLPTAKQRPLLFALTGNITDVDTEEFKQGELSVVVRGSVSRGDRIILAPPVSSDVSIKEGDVLFKGEVLGTLAEPEDCPQGLSVVFKEGAGAISKADALFRCLAFVTDEPPNAREGSRTVEASLVTDDCEPVTACCVVKVTPPLVSVSVSDQLFPYREGTGPSRLGIFEVLDQGPEDQSWGGGFILAELVKGLCAEDALGLEEGPTPQQNNAEEKAKGTASPPAPAPELVLGPERALAQGDGDFLESIIPRPQAPPDEALSEADEVSPPSQSLAAPAAPSGAGSRTSPQLPAVGSGRTGRRQSQTSAGGGKGGSGLQSAAASPPARRRGSQASRSDDGQGPPEDSGSFTARRTSVSARLKAEKKAYDRELAERHYARQMDSWREMLMNLRGNDICPAGEPTVRDVTIAGQLVGAMLMLKAGFILTLARPQGEGGEEVVTQAHVAALLNSITYENTSKNPRVLRKVLRVTVNDSFAHSSCALAEVLIHPVNDVTEVRRTCDEVVKYRQGTGVSDAVPLFQDCSLHDPDTVAFNDGYLIVEPVAGGDINGDQLLFLTPEQQVQLFERDAKHVRLVDAAPADAASAAPSGSPLSPVSPGAAGVVGKQKSPAKPPGRLSNSPSTGPQGLPKQGAQLQGQPSPRVLQASAVTSPSTPGPVDMRRQSLAVMGPSGARERRERQQRKRDRQLTESRAHVAALPASRIAQARNPGSRLLVRATDDGALWLLQPDAADAEPREVLIGSYVLDAPTLSGMSSLRVQFVSMPGGLADPEGEDERPRTGEGGAREAPVGDREGQQPQEAVPPEGETDQAEVDERLGHPTLPRICTEVPEDVPPSPRVFDGTVTIEVVEAVMWAVGYTNVHTRLRPYNIIYQLRVKAADEGAEGRIRLGVNATPAFLSAPEHTLQMRYKLGSGWSTINPKITFHLEGQSSDATEGFLACGFPEGADEGDELRFDFKGSPFILRDGQLHFEKEIIGFGQVDKQALRIDWAWTTRLTPRMCAALARCMQYRCTADKPGKPLRLIEVVFSDTDSAETASRMRHEVSMADEPTEIDFALTQQPVPYILSTGPLVVFGEALVTDPDTEVFDSVPQCEAYLAVGMQRVPQPGSERCFLVEGKGVSWGDAWEVGAPITVDGKPVGELTQQTHNSFKIQLKECPIASVQQLVRAVAYDNADTRTRNTRRGMQVQVRGGEAAPTKCTVGIELAAAPVDLSACHPVSLRDASLQPGGCEILEHARLGLKDVAGCATTLKCDPPVLAFWVTDSGGVCLRPAMTAKETAGKNKQALVLKEYNNAYDILLDGKTRAGVVTLDDTGAQLTLRLLEDRRNLSASAFLRVIRAILARPRQSQLQSPVDEDSRSRQVSSVSLQEEAVAHITLTWSTQTGSLRQRCQLRVMP
eukprot:TRINITY_DN3586_c0_g1_i1.p1 TRINITY_DN3586_c0_g1~~TRINITY_DN3586_c0_g1_i1.p1  ORF type:complete len:2727 (+),score=756.40 TRINITY_DN3586_c0_g1_i1:82-8181(+)